MNKLNETLRAVRTQKKVYQKKANIAEKENNMQELYKLSKKIQELDTEEYELLKELNRGEV